MHILARKAVWVPLALAGAFSGYTYFETRRQLGWLQAIPAD
jgi:hypothetical protein